MKNEKEIVIEIRAIKKELEAANAELALMATHDHLTGLPNRRLFEENLMKD